MTGKGATKVERIPSHRSGELPVYIQIDRQPFAVNAWTLTGAEIRSLPFPAIFEKYDLWQVVPGASDRLVAAEDVIDLRGARFFTSPRIINAG